MVFFDSSHEDGELITNNRSLFIFALHPMNHSSRPAVIKLGGALLSDPAVLESFWPAVSMLSKTMPVVIVHGGGPQATEMARRLGHEPTIVEGRRVTTDLDLSIVHWTMCGQLNTQLVARALAGGIRAVGFSTINGATLRVNRRPPWNVGGRQIDFGWVGDVASVDPTLINTLLARGYTPILAPLGIDAEGNTYNVNADTVSQSIATAIDASSYLLITESGGVRRTPSDPSSRLAVIDQTMFRAGYTEGWIRDGMLVKLKVAFEARNAGIDEVVITSPDDILLRKKGTQIV